jgi:uncharacterized protein (TIGR02145 family)
MKKINHFTIMLLVLLLMACNKNNSNANANITQSNAANNLLSDINITGEMSVAKIGSQRWMSSNLNVSRYRNGDRIPQVTNPAKWAALTTGAWCWHNNDSLAGTVYGKIYNWYAVNDPRGLAPAGWHIPTDAEWTTLINTLGGNLVAGGKMKETGLAHWSAPNTNATNSSGFTGLPGGNRYNNGQFLYFRIYGWGWSANTDSSGLPLYYRLNYNDGTVFRGAADKRDGFSIRCVKD